MPKQTRPTQQMVAQQVDARPAELLQEFYQHYDEFIATHPTMTDRFLIFQGWVVQKIAGLQLVVLDLEERYSALQKPQKRA